MAGNGANRLKRRSGASGCWLGRDVAKQLVRSPASSAFWSSHSCEGRRPKTLASQCKQVQGTDLAGERGARVQSIRRGAATGTELLSF
jgi:hypothetical protein